MMIRRLMAPAIAPIVSASTPKRDTESQGIFIVFAIEECNDRLWHCALTATVKTVCWTNSVTGSIHVIIECRCYVSAYFFLSVSCTCAR